MTYYRKFRCKATGQYVSELYREANKSMVTVEVHARLHPWSTNLELFD